MNFAVTCWQPQLLPAVYKYHKEYFPSQTHDQRANIHTGRLPAVRAQGCAVLQLSTAQNTYYTPPHTHTHTEALHTQCESIPLALCSTQPHPVSCCYLTAGCPPIASRHRHCTKHHIFFGLPRGADSHRLATHSAIRQTRLPGAQGTASAAGYA